MQQVPRKRQMIELTISTEYLTSSEKVMLISMILQADPYDLVNMQTRVIGTYANVGPQTVRNFYKKMEALNILYRVQNGPFGRLYKLTLENM